MEPHYVFIALAGSAVLGYLFAISIIRIRTNQLSAENAAITKTLNEKDATVIRLQSECEARQMAVENLQKISQDIEYQSIEKAKALETLRLENSKLLEEIQYFSENPIEKVREIDVIREVPILVLKELSLPESRSEKAKKLMKAFTKGYLAENEILQVITNAEIIDEE